MVLSTQANITQNAYRLALMAKAVYLEEPTIDYASTNSPFEGLLHISDNRIQARLSIHGQNAILAFRGSDTDKEWLEALVFGQI